MRGRILIVEDETDLVEALEFQLRKAGHTVRVAENGNQALALARQEPLPDLIVLDLMLPGLSGKEVCRQLKADPKTARIPVLMASALGDEIDRIVGFELGADDYVVKPYSMRELVLRVEALLRRGGLVQPDGDEPLVFGRLRVDEGGFRAWVDGEEVTLTKTEFKLLTTLLARKGRVLSRETLLADVWGITSDVTSRTVDTHVKRLRKRLGEASEYIETLRGVGYRFRDRP